MIRILTQEEIDQLYNEVKKIDELERKLEINKLEIEKEKLLLETEKIGLQIERNELIEEVENGRKRSKITGTGKKQQKNISVS